MARPKGQPKLGGRAKGTPNKATADIRALAGAYTAQALTTLAYVMQHGEAEAARVSAARELLDRAYGRSPQAVTGADGKALFPKIQVLFGIGSSDAGDDA